MLKNISVCTRKLWRDGFLTFFDLILLYGHYFSTDKPVINTTKLPKKIPLFTGYSEELICDADGHPPPKILWLYSSGGKVSPSSVTKLTVTEAGFYNCTATNEIDSVSYEVEVILKGKNTLTLNRTV